MTRRALFAIGWIVLLAITLIIGAYYTTARAHDAMPHIELEVKENGG